MLRELVNKFSGRQLTAIILAAILVPGAVGAAVTFQSVAIVDPFTRKQAWVDSSRRLSVFDPIAGYRNNPLNMVEIYVSNNISRCETRFQYKVPAGKALIITAISGYEQYYNLSYAGITVYDEANCQGAVLTSHFSPVSNSSLYAPIAIDLGVGILVKPGKTVSVASTSNVGLTFLHGYLVPAAAAPAAGLAETESEPTPITADEFAAKLKRYKQ